MGFYDSIRSCDFFAVQVGSHSLVFMPVEASTSGSWTGMVCRITMSPELRSSGSDIVGPNTNPWVEMPETSKIIDPILGYLKTLRLT